MTANLNTIQLSQYCTCFAADGVTVVLYQVFQTYNGLPTIGADQVRAITMWCLKVTVCFCYFSIQCVKPLLDVHLCYMAGISAKVV